MYKIIKIISYLIRQFWLPNPFANMFEPNIAEIVNWAVGGVFVLLAYILTGTWYESEEGYYWLGSLGFLINYAILTGLLLLISKLISVLWLIIVIFLIAYILLCVIEYKLFNRHRNVF